ncbi:MAG TPA: DUF998 domain-containing protein [Blastococcus sp.]|nr:DUF998 domain-containing protein [Blastococcus sp.]
MTTREAIAAAPAAAGPVARRPERSRVAGIVVLLAGLVAAVSNCAFVFRAVSPSRLDPFNSMISELEVPGQPFSEFFRWSSLLSGVAAAVFAVGLSRRIPRGRLGLAGAVALAVFGAAGAFDALIPMDCAPSASAVCLRADLDDPTNWLSKAHTWFDVGGTVALLVALWLLGRHLRHRTGWRVAADASGVGFVGLCLGSAVLTVMSIWYLPGVGLVQRLVVLATSAWLAVLAVAQRRVPGD